MDWNNNYSWNPLLEDVMVAEQQRKQFGAWVTPLSGWWTTVLDQSAMNLFKWRTGIVKIVDLFWIRDDSGLSIRNLYNVAVLKKYGMLEERNWKYLDEVVARCYSKGMELSHKELLDGVGYVVKIAEMPEDKGPIVDPYDAIDVAAVTKPVEIEAKSMAGNMDMAIVEVDLNIKNVDIPSLDALPIEQVRSIYKRVTGKWISPATKNNKQRFIDKLILLNK